MIIRASAFLVCCLGIAVSCFAQDRDSIGMVVAGTSRGSCVYIGDGLALTATHVVEGMHSVVVTRDDRVWNADVLFADDANDTAVLDVPGCKLKPSLVATAAPKGRLTGIGFDRGQPTGLRAFSGQIDTAHQWIGCVVFFARAVPGDSGGGVFNSDGEVVGVVSACNATDAMQSNATETIATTWADAKAAVWHARRMRALR